MASPISAGEHSRLQALFTIALIAFFCFLMTDDLLMTRFGWLRALIALGRHFMGVRWPAPIETSLHVEALAVRSARGKLIANT